jgi:hypothetical protein
MEMYQFQYQLEGVIPRRMNSSNKKNDYLNNYGIIEKNAYTGNIPISCDFKKGIIAIGGYSNGSFKLLKGQKVI